MQQNKTTPKKIFNLSSNLYAKSNKKDATYEKYFLSLVVCVERN